MACTDEQCPIPDWCPGASVTEDIETQALRTREDVGVKFNLTPQQAQELAGESARTAIHEVFEIMDAIEIVAHTHPDLPEADQKMVARYLDRAVIEMDVHFDESLYNRLRSTTQSPHRETDESDPV